jgi:hypothetical protein
MCVTTATKYRKGRANPAVKQMGLFAIGNVSQRGTRKVLFYGSRTLVSPTSGYEDLYILRCNAL